MHPIGKARAFRAGLVLDDDGGDTDCLQPLTKAYECAFIAAGIPIRDDGLRAASGHVSDQVEAPLE